MRPPIVRNRHFLSRRLAVAATAMLLAGGISLTVGISGAWAADGSDGIAGSPSANGGVDQGRSRFSYQVEPGQTVKDEYLVENTGTTAQAVTVYATDAYNADDGTFSLLEGTEAPKGAGSWVTFANGTGRVQVALEPGAQQILPFTVTTPADANPGDHAGGIVVSALSPAGQVSVDRRVAIRLYVRVKGLLQPSMTISSIDSSYEGTINPFAGDTKIRVSLSNTGNVSLSANTDSQVRGIFGIPLSGVTDQEIDELLPGSSRTVTLTVSGVGAWVYLNPHVSLAATIDPDAINPGPLPTAERETSLLVVPWAFLVLLLVAAVTWLIVRLSRKRDSTRAAAWIEYTEAEARRKAREEALVSTAAGAPRDTPGGTAR
jgi:dihydroorotate dehydrogenase (fumarate)